MGAGRFGFLSAVISVISVIGSGVLILSAGARADTALWVRGASVAPIPMSDVLKRIPPGYTVQEVDYPAGLFPWTGLATATGAQSIDAGVLALDQAIRDVEGDGRTLVIGESLGSMVVDQELRELAGRSDAPDPASVRFELIAAPARPGGLLSYLPAGMYEPLTGTIAEPAPETPYDVTVIKLQYDGLASWPDRPWRLVSVVNALVGASVYHATDHYGTAAQLVLNGQVPQQNVARVVNSVGGVTTTYNIQQSPSFLHSLEPVFPALVSEVNKRVLAPAVNLGYSELTPAAGPHLALGGRLVKAPTGAATPLKAGREPDRRHRGRTQHR